MYSGTPLFELEFIRSDLTKNALNFRAQRTLTIHGQTNSSDIRIWMSQIVHQSRTVSHMHIERIVRAYDGCLDTKYR